MLLSESFESPDVIYCLIVHARATDEAPDSKPYQHERYRQKSRAEHPANLLRTCNKSKETLHCVKSVRL